LQTENNDHTDSKLKDLTQENFLWKDVSKKLEEKAKQISIENEHLKNQVCKDQFTIKELSQENVMSNEYDPVLKSNSLSKEKKIIILGVSLILVMIISFIVILGMVEPAGNTENPLKSKFVIENLRGDKVSTFMRWNILPQDTLVVNIINSELYSSEQIQIIKNTITSTELLNIDDSLQHKGPKGESSTYYDGWQGALDYLSLKNTKYNIPKKIDVIESKNGEGQVIITLSNAMDTDGYSGYTKSVVDQNQILKSTITIYNMDELSSSQIETITRHEFGHALGLAHSTAPEDLMYPTIQSNYPYISQCDIDALIALYDGKESSDVICQK